MENIKIIKSKRKTISLQIKPEGSIELKVPVQITDAQIQDFLHQKSGWIEKHLQAVQERQKQVSQIKPLTQEEIQKVANQALEVIPERVAYFAPLVGVNYGRITIRNQKSRWGSCSSKGNLNFNCLLMLMPPEVLDYVVVHELCHRKEMNHSSQFWAEVRKVLPDYEKQKSWLKEHGDEIMMRMTG
ncbi:MAG: M48 family metallopeptidase [Ruminococcus flavefaciens]|nr:M48 family metallopeptidase [Ruminococcus flavefaciens]